MGSHPCAWSQSLATKSCRKPRQVEYLHGPSIIPMGSQTFVPTVSLKTSFPRIPTYPAGYIHGPLQHPWVAHLYLAPISGNKALPHAPKTPILGPTGTLSPKVSVKNEVALSTNQAGRVPTWSLYNTHGVAPLCLAPFLGYTRVIPLLNHCQKGPHPQTIVPTVSLKTDFPGIPSCPKNTYSGSHKDTFAQGLPKKRVFPGYPLGGSSTHMTPL